MRAAWISVAVIPVAFVAAMVLGEGLLSLQGYDPGSEEPAPSQAVLLAGIPALLVMVAPTIPAILFGVRANRQGVAGGRIPAVIGAVVAAGAVLTNTLPLLLAGRG